VTYRAFTYFLHNIASPPGSMNQPSLDESRCPGIISVKHGGGREFWEVDRKVLKAIETLFHSGAERQAFHLSMVITKAIDETAHSARVTEGSRYMQAFADGRLKRRKQRGSNKVKVWIEEDKRAEPDSAHDLLDRVVTDPVAVRG
jgi:hypothetical protein